MLALGSCLLILLFTGYQFIYIVEESNVLTLRARMVVMLFCTAIIWAAAFFGLDDLYMQQWLYGSNDTLITNFYPYIAFILGGIGAYFFVRKSTVTEQVVIISLGLILARLVHYYSKEYVYWGPLYALLLFFYIPLVFNIVKDGLTQTTAVLGGIVLLVPITIGIDILRDRNYYALYFAVIFTGAIWMRYFWLLEYKRRKKCDACGGWGQRTSKFRDIFWWAVGYKERVQTNSVEAANKEALMKMLGHKDYQATPTICPKCMGRGWHYRNENLLHD